MCLLQPVISFGMVSPNVDAIIYAIFIFTIADEQSVLVQATPEGVTL